MPTVVHTSLDGLSTALGRSQVVAPAIALSKRGWKLKLVTLEPESLNAAQAATLRNELAEFDIDWTFDRYRRDKLSPATNSLKLAHMIERARRQADLLWCRSYVTTAIAAAQSAWVDQPYVFDTRGYWVDEKREAGRWFQDRWSLAAARGAETFLFRRAAGVVSLTELAAADIRAGTFGKKFLDERCVAIPTCVDYARFTPQRGMIPDARLEGKCVIAYVGSINPSYDFEESLVLVKRCLARRSDCVFLALTAQTDIMRERIRRTDIDLSRVIVKSVPHQEMPRWLPWIDIGLLLLVKPNRAKHASMPTKLGEFFASGARVIHHGCNREVGAWVKETAGGLSLSNLASESLAEALDFVMNYQRDESAIAHTREKARRHFSVASGADRYATLFNNLLSLKPAL